MTSKRWAAALALALGLVRPGARAQEIDPRPLARTPPPPTVVASTAPPQSSTVVSAPVSLPPTVQQTALTVPDQLPATPPSPVLTPPAPAAPVTVPPESLSRNPSPQPPPRSGEGEPNALGCLSPPLRLGEGVGGRGSATESQTAVRAEPLAILGKPLPLAPEEPVSAAPPVAPGAVTLVRGQAPDGLTTSISMQGPPPVPPPDASTGLPPIVPPGEYNSGVVIDRPLNKGFFDRCKDWFGGGTHSSTAGAHAWQSDHCFDTGLISPVSNPFFFEDPRALTEIRPLFFYQKAPSSIGGGNAEFYGLQGRVAFNECWSLVINKFGLVSLNPHIPEVSSGTGFAEVNIGGKYTFLRNEQSGSAAAVGLNLELPIGSKKEYQDTGTLGLDPYITFGQSFGRSSFGGFNFLAEGGYNFAIDNKQSEFLHGSLHLDYDIGNAHRFYPLVELNWFHYTSSGKTNDFSFEGADLINFGSTQISGTDFVDLALGLRYKFSENMQLGFYVEAPISGKSKGIEEYRVGLDMIFRY